MASATTQNSDWTNTTLVDQSVPNSVWLNRRELTLDDGVRNQRPSTHPRNDELRNRAKTGTHWHRSDAMKTAYSTIRCKPLFSLLNFGGP